MQDFAKWSGLTVADAKVGLEAVQAGLEHEAIDGQTYWFSVSSPSKNFKSPTAYLLSVYDEFVTSYKDRSAMAGEELTRLFNTMGNALQYIIVIDGQFVGTWKRILKKDAVHIQLNPLAKLVKEENQAMAEAARKYGDFLNLPIVLETGQ